MTLNDTKELSLCEILVKTSYMVQITTVNDKVFEKPIGYGSGFIIEYKDTKFFITADHVLNIEDYEKDQRLCHGNIVSIFNNISIPNNYSTIITPLGGFYYMDRFNLAKPNDKPELIDVCLCKLKELNLKYPFLTEEVHFGEVTINQGEKKFCFMENQLVEPNYEMTFFVYGKIRHKIKGLVLNSQGAIKENLKFVNKNCDYYLFNTPEKIIDGDDWSGLSGSPIINQKGECVGVLCSITLNSKSIWVMPIDKIKMLMDIAIIEEQLPQVKSGD